MEKQLRFQLNFPMWLILTNFTFSLALTEATSILYTIKIVGELKDKRILMDETMMLFKIRFY